MKIAFNNNQPVIDAHDLGPLFDIDPAEVQAKMRAGEITSKYETGEGADAGRFRLTFFYAARSVRLTCASDGTVLSTVRIGKGQR